MEARQKLYKAGAKHNPTLGERIKIDKERRQQARLDKFSMRRQIQADKSTEVSEKSTKTSKIADRNEKLRVFRIQKNIQKIKEVQEQRSPFIVAVPVGRWLEKKEKIPRTRVDLNDTPVRAMMNERALKKSTIKNLIGKSTAKKENVMMFTASNTKPLGAKSKKNILTEIKSISVNSVAEMNEAPLPSMSIDLNTTFDLSPEKSEMKAEVERKHIRRSHTMPEIITKASKQIVRENFTPQAKKVSVTKPVKKPNLVVNKASKKLLIPQTKKQTATRFVKPVILQESKALVAPVRKPVVTQRAVLAKKVSAPKSVSSESPKAPSTETNYDPSVPKIIAKPVSNKVDESHSETYKLYKSMMNSYATSITAQLEKIEKERESFIERLDEGQQIFVQQTIQQGKLLATDKLKRFEESLLEYEDGLNRPNDPKRVTEDDVENYWYLIFDEIKKLKNDFVAVEKMKDMLSTVASEKKRRTRRTYISEDGTPRRSRRIAEIAGTPLHNASCYGCVSINTPKSAPKRRTTVGKSVLFKDVVETPKRNEAHRSSNRKKSTPARNLVRMNAVEFDDEDELAELL